MQLDSRDLMLVLLKCKMLAFLRTPLRQDGLMHLLGDIKYLPTHLSLPYHISGSSIGRRADSMGTPSCSHFGSHFQHSWAGTEREAICFRYRAHEDYLASGAQDLDTCSCAWWLDFHKHLTQYHSSAGMGTEMELKRGVNLAGVNYFYKCGQIFVDFFLHVLSLWY